jgi:hypothetical protein
MQQTLQLLNYLATQEAAVLSNHASNMVLAAHSSAASQKHEAKQVDTSSFQAMQLSHQTMGQF